MWSLKYQSSHPTLLNPQHSQDTQLTRESLQYISYCWIICRLARLPWYTIVFISVHVLNSRSQLVIVDSGAITKKGPWMPTLYTSCKKAMDWIVLPNPISSAKMQFCLQIPHREGRKKRKWCQKILSLQKDTLRHYFKREWVQTIPDKAFIWWVLSFTCYTN